MIRRRQTQSIDVAVIVGSLRKGSINRMVANALIESVSSRSGNCSYNQDLDDQPPAEWTEFRDRIAGSNAVLFVTSEYNRSIQAAL
jgi:chromate reductase